VGNGSLAKRGKKEYAVIIIERNTSALKCDASVKAREDLEAVNAAFPWSRPVTGRR
jgi:hypothetical protein